MKNEAQDIHCTENKNTAKVFVETAQQTRKIYLVPVLDSHYLEDRKKSVLDVIEVLSIWFVLSS